MFYQPSRKGILNRPDELLKMNHKSAIEMHSRFKPYKDALKFATEIAKEIGKELIDSLPTR